MTIPKFLRDRMIRAVVSVLEGVNSPPARVAVVIYSDDGKLLAVAGSNRDDPADLDKLREAVTHLDEPDNETTFYDGTGREFIAADRGGD